MWHSHFWLCVVEHHQMEIVVVFAGQRFSRDREPIQITRELYCIRFRRRPRNALFEQHREILSATRQRVQSQDEWLPSGAALRRESGSKTAASTAANRLPKSVRSPSIAGSPVTRCHIRCGG